MAFPKASVLDNFNRSENPLSTGWETALLNSIQANGTTAQGNNAGFNIHVYGTSYTGSQEVYCTVSTKGGTGHELSMGLMSKDATSLATIDGYAFHWTVVSGAGNDTWTIERVDNGVSTVLANGTVEIVNGDVLGLRFVAGGTLIAFRNGAQIGTASDTTYSGTGKLSLTIEGTTFRIDNFGGGELTAYTQTNSGGVTPAGAIARMGDKLASGALSSIVGTIARQSNKVASGALSSITGTLARMAGKTTAGSATPSGALTRLTSKLFAGELTSEGALETARAFLISLSGSLSSAGALIRSTSKTLTGALTPDGAISKLTSKSPAGSVTPSGGITNQTNKTLSGSVTPSGTISRSIAKFLTGTLESAGTLARMTAKAMTGTLSSAGEIVKSIRKILAGILNPGGTVETEASEPSTPATAGSAALEEIQLYYLQLDELTHVAQLDEIPQGTQLVETPLYAAELSEVQPYGVKLEETR